MNTTLPSIPRLIALSDAHCHVEWGSLPYSRHLHSQECTDATQNSADITHTCGGSQIRREKTANDFPFQLRRAVLCGTQPEIDWPILKELLQSSVQLNVPASVALMRCTHSFCNECTSSAEVTDPCKAGLTNLIVGFGIHPWYVPEIANDERKATAKDPNAEKQSIERLTTEAPQHTSLTQKKSYDNSSLSFMLNQLRRLLCEFPKAIVGEIGLDKIKGPSEYSQVHAFLAQIKLAAEYNRPVSVHCVRYYGLLLQLLQQLSAEDTPPAIILHGFTGSFDVAQSLLKLKPKRFSPGSNKRGVVRIADRLFFSVCIFTSARVNGFVEKTLPLLCKPVKRILLETDLRYQICGPGLHSDLSYENDVCDPEFRPSFFPGIVGVANSEDILTSLGQIFNTIPSDLVLTPCEEQQRDGSSCMSNELPDPLEDVFLNAFSTIL